MNADYYEAQLRTKLSLITNDQVRSYVDQLLAETKKEEDKKKNEAPTAGQGPKPMKTRIANLVQQLDAAALAGIRDSAGAEVHDLVVDLIEYAKSL